MAWFSASYEFDGRSLRLFRSLLGARMLLNVLDIALHFSPFLSEGGFVPAKDVLALQTRATKWNAYLVFPGCEGMTMVVHLCCAACIMFGRDPRPALLAGLILEQALVRRLGPLRVPGPDNNFIMVLLLATALPWQQHSAFPQANFHLLTLQLSLVYCGSGWLKTSWEWSDGEAVFCLLHTSLVPKNPVVAFLRGHRQLCRLLSLSSLWLERLGWALLWVPVPFVRTLGLLAFAGLHIGIALVLRVRDFQLVMVCPIVALLPTSFWDTLLLFCRRWHRVHLRQNRRLDEEREQEALATGISQEKAAEAQTLMANHQASSCPFRVGCKPVSDETVHAATSQTTTSSRSSCKPHCSTAVPMTHKVAHIYSALVWAISVSTASNALARNGLSWVALNLPRAVPRVVWMPLAYEQPLMYFAPRPNNPHAWPAAFGETMGGNFIDLMPGGLLGLAWRQIDTRSSVQAAAARGDVQLAVQHHRLRYLLRPRNFRKASRTGKSLCRNLCNTDYAGEKLKAAVLYRFKQETFRNMTRGKPNSTVLWRCSCNATSQEQTASLEQRLKQFRTEL